MKSSEGNEVELIRRGPYFYLKVQEVNALGTVPEGILPVGAESLEEEPTGQGGPTPYAIRKPERPREDEKGEHILGGHVPYQAWCSACVRGRSADDPHKRRKDKEEKSRCEA